MNKRKRKKSEKTAQDRKRFCHYLALSPGCLKSDDWTHALLWISKSLQSQGCDGYGPNNPLLWKDRDLMKLTKRFWLKERKRSVIRFESGRYDYSRTVLGMPFRVLDA